MNPSSPTCTLSDCTYENTPFFSLNGSVMEAKTVDIYDGDTATFVLRVHDNLYAYKMRLSGIDTPEIRVSKANPNRKEEKRAAIYARNRFLQLVCDQAIDLEKPYTKKQIKAMLGENRKLVHLKCGKAGKFGRTLVHVFLKEEDLDDKGKCVNKVLLREGLAYSYRGGKKNRDFRSYFSQRLL